MRRRDGALRDVEVRRTGFMRGRRKLWLCLCHDITERKGQRTRCAPARRSSARYCRPCRRRFWSSTPRAGGQHEPCGRGGGTAGCNFAIGDKASEWVAFREDGSAIRNAELPMMVTLREGIAQR